MAQEQKKYSLISVDTGVKEPTETLEQAVGVRTIRMVLDGEETIVVSSQSAHDQPADQLQNVDIPFEERDSGTDAQEEQSSFFPGDSADSPYSHETREQPRSFEDTGRSALSEDEEEESSVPFARMQAVIIIALIVLIVVFFVYFNFLR